MKSIDRLRKYGARFNNSHDAWSGIGTEILEFVDEIEREVADMVPMPVDADGVPIHVGDVMENIVCPPVHREVTGVGVECFYGWDEGNGRYSQFDANYYRHHHAPTVEDVLAKFAQEMNENLGMYTGEAIDADEWREADERTIAEYAAKLRLAGDE